MYADDACKPRGNGMDHVPDLRTSAVAAVFVPGAAAGDSVFTACGDLSTVALAAVPPPLCARCASAPASAGPLGGTASCAVLVAACASTTAATTNAVARRMCIPSPPCDERTRGDSAPDLGPADDLDARLEMAVVAIGQRRLRPVGEVDRLARRQLALHRVVIDPPRAVLARVHL